MGLSVLCSLPPIAFAHKNLNDHPVRFAIIGDRTGGHTAGIYGEIVEEIIRLKPDFVISVGDLIEGYIDDKDQILEQWVEYKALIEPLTMPFYNTPGNHDIWDDQSAEIYLAEEGEPYYSFNHGKWIHFTILDNSRWSDIDEFPAEQFAWMKKDLKKHRKFKHKFVLMHQPYWYNTLAAGKTDRLHDVFVEYGVDAVFHGHFHTYFSGTYDGIRYTTIGSSGGAAQTDVGGLYYHYAMVTVDEENLYIAPIRKGSVLPWDHITGEELHLVGDINNSGLSFTSKLMLDDNLMPVGNSVAVQLLNLNSDFTLMSRLQWSAVDEISFNPAGIPVSIDAADSMMIEFSLISSAPLKSLPTLSIEYPYATEKAFDLSIPLSITRQTTANRVNEAPTIDGEISESSWENTVTAYFASDGSEMSIDKFSIAFSYDDHNLYIAARCHDDEIASLKTDAKEHDGAVYQDDCVGFFFQPDIVEQVVYQIYFNSAGVVFDQKISPNEDGQFQGDREWNGDYTVATVIGEDGWTLEAAVPLSQLGVEGTSSSEWGCNFRRKHQRFNSTGDWLVPISYDPATYGSLKFE